MIICQYNTMCLMSILMMQCKYSLQYININAISESTMIPMIVIYSIIIINDLSILIQYYNINIIIQY